MLIRIGLIHLMHARFTYKLSWLKIMLLNCQYWGVCISRGLEDLGNISIVFITGYIK